MATTQGMKPRTRVALPTSLSLFVLLSTSAAVAESGRSDAGPRPCEIWSAPAQGEAIPANAPALAAMRSPWSANPSGPTELTASRPPAEFERRIDARQSIALLYAPTSPLSANERYEIDFVCDPRTPSSALLRTSFTTTPAVALPATTGSARFVEPAKGTSGIVELTPSPELAAFLPVASFEFWVRGTMASYSTYGFFKPEGGVLKFRLARDEVTGAYRRSSLCGEVIADAFEETLEVRAHVAGTSSDPVAALVKVTLDCTGYPNEGAPDAGDDAPARGAACGCRVPRGSTVAPTSLGVLALSLVFLGRRAWRRRARRERR